MVPNRGYQHLLSFGLRGKIGPIQFQLKPEHHYAQNKNFQGFPETHYPIIWAKRYRLWNHIDLPERHGFIRHNKTLIGQSYLKVNYKSFSIGISNESLWWGPSVNNSIMMSNNSRSFPHISFNTIKPLKSKIGNFAFQLVSGKLESSKHNPPNTDYTYAGTKLFVPKINQIAEKDDWRYIQAIVLNYSPSFIDGLKFGIIRWSQTYSALVKGKYDYFMPGNPTYFPVFQNLFRKNDKNIDLEIQTNQAAGGFLHWYWKDSKAEVYFELYYNDSKQNLRDLILDTDHAAAHTIGIRKFFEKNNLIFSWEWTKMEQSASRILRNAGSWYEHSQVFDGFTNYGEVLGSAIGPGSNAHYFTITKTYDNIKRIDIEFQIIENDNDFYYEAFASAQDPRRYWKDFNLKLGYTNKFKNFLISANLIFIRSLNYQWELLENSTAYYQPGKDLNNFHISIKTSYTIK